MIRRTYTSTMNAQGAVVSTSTEFGTLAELLVSIRKNGDVLANLYTLVNGVRETKVSQFASLAQARIVTDVTPTTYTRTLYAIDANGKAVALGMVYRKQ